jgi:TonB family protein
VGADAVLRIVANANRLEIKAIYRGVVQSTRYLGPGGTDVIGAARGADAPVDAAYIDGEAFTLIEAAGDQDFLVNVTARMDGQVTAGDELLPLAAWVTANGTPFAVPTQGQVVLHCGQLSFVLGHTVAPEVVGKPPLVLKWSEQKYTAFSGLALLLTVLVISLVPPDVKALTHDRINAQLRFTDFVIKPPETPPPPPAPRGRAGGADKAGQRHAGPAGKMGDAKARTQNARFAIAGPRDTRDPHLAKQLREQEIGKAGILGVIRRSQGDLLASVFGQESALGNDPTSLLGNLIAGNTASAYGVGGLGPAGTGAGGAGEGEGTIGTGVLGTIGGYKGERAAGYGPAGGGRLAGRRTITPDFIAGQPSVRGSLDKDIIRRIIRRHLNEVKFCYEQELARNQELGGRIAVNFTIAPTGQVAAAVVQSTTMGNVRVESCLVGAVRRWEFPKPAGGGLVIATYPFNFMSAGQRE